MKKTLALVSAFGILGSFPAFTQDHPHLHTSSQWEECSFQLDPSLTQEAWHRFTREAAEVAYFRPLTGARSIGRGKVDFSLLQWQTRIDESSEAWNNTFVHPDSAHWLIGGPRLAIPGLALRIGITEKMDVGFYWTTNPYANYSIAGAQLQYNFLPVNSKGMAASARLTYSTIYGPRDLTFSIYGVDLVGSRNFKIYSDWLSVTPYASASLMLASSHERTEGVNLSDENVVGAQASFGAVAHISFVQLAVEYNQGVTNTLSYRLGAAFRLYK